MKRFIFGCTGNFIAFTLFSVAIMSCTSNSYAQTAPGVDKSDHEILALSVGDDPVYSFEYDSEGRLVKYADYMMLEIIEISYEPILTLKVYYPDTPQDDLAAVEKYMDIFNVELNDQNCITYYKSRYYGLDEEGQPSFWDNDTSLEYDDNGRLILLSSSSGTSFEIIYDADGRLLQSVNPGFVNQYVSSDIKNVDNQWMPLWYVCGGLEMTGLVGNAPAYFVTDGEQKFPDESVSTARFNYTFNPDTNLVETLLFQADDDPELNFTVSYKDSIQ